MGLGDVDCTRAGNTEAFRDAIGFARAVSGDGGAREPDLDGSWAVWRAKNDAQRMQLTICLANLLAAVVDDESDWQALLALIEEDA